MKAAEKVMWMDVGAALNNATFANFDELVQYLESIDLKLSRGNQIRVWNYAMTHGKIKHV